MTRLENWLSTSGFWVWDRILARKNLYHLGLSSQNMKQTADRCWHVTQCMSMVSLTKWRKNSLKYTKSSMSTPTLPSFSFFPHFHLENRENLWWKCSDSESVFDSLGLCICHRSIQGEKRQWEVWINLQEGEGRGLIESSRRLRNRGKEVFGMWLEGEGTTSGQYYKFVLTIASLNWDSNASSWFIPCILQNNP